MRRRTTLGTLLAIGCLSIAIDVSAQAPDLGRPLGAVRPQRMSSLTDDDFLPLPDRWRIGFPRWQRYEATPGEHPLVEGGWLDPYNQNLLKGDYALFGQDVFFAFTGVSDTLFEAVRIPKPSGIPASSGNRDEFFGDSEILIFNQNFVTSFEFFKGQSAFKPRDWEIRFTPVFNINYVDAGEINVLDVDPREGTTRLDGFVGVQEALVEYHLGDLNDYYDFVSTRLGVQGFTSDFRGFIFSDNNLGARLFGNWGANQWQWNLAYFRPLEKDTNSGLNRLDSFEAFEDREQDVAIANVYRQDTFWFGYTTQFSVHVNRDHADETHFDANGFLTRPAVVGSVIPPGGIRFHDVDAYYFGWAGEGHVDRVNVSHAFYWVVGEDDFNPIAGRQTDVSAQLLALELSIDRDWLRPRLSFLWASGDSDPLDGTARGFDTILDNTAFAGGGFSYFNRQGLQLTGAPVPLSGRFSLLPNLRSSKIEGQPNFVNPGILVSNAGFEIEVTPKVRAFLNFNYLRFAETESLELVLQQADIDPNIGIDYGFGLQYRPFLIDNVIFVVSAAALTPFEGLREILRDQTLFSTFAAVTLTW